MLDDNSGKSQCLVQAQLPSNSGRKSAQIRLRKIGVWSGEPVLVMEISARGEMFERAVQGQGKLVTDFEWAFPQILISPKALEELLHAVRCAHERLDAFKVQLGVEEGVFDVELGYIPGVSLRADLPSVTIRCGVSAATVECVFGVDPSCLLELAEGLERIIAVASEALG